MRDRSDAGAEAVGAHSLEVARGLLEHGLHDHLEPLLPPFGRAEVCPRLLTGSGSPAVSLCQILASDQKDTTEDADEGAHCWGVQAGEGGVPD